MVNIGKVNICLVNADPFYLMFFTFDLTVKIMITNIINSLAKNKILPGVGSEFINSFIFHK